METQHVHRSAPITLVAEADKKTYRASCPALAGCTRSSGTPELARALLRDAIEERLAKGEKYAPVRGLGTRGFEWLALHTDRAPTPSSVKHLPGAAREQRSSMRNGGKHTDAWLSRHNKRAF